MHGLRLVAHLLAGDVGHLAASTADEIRHGTTEACRLIKRTVVVHNHDPGILRRDNQGVREDGGVVTGSPMKDLDGRFDFDALGHDHHDAGADHGQMQGGKLRRAKLHLALHEIMLQHIILREQGFREREADDPFGQAGSL